MKIFIVEDDENIVELLGDELRQWGYETKAVKDFNDVANEIGRYNPNLVLMDITLPYYNGFYWTQKIRQNSNVPIIFISSHNNQVDMVSAMQFGADDYITKPIDINLTRVKIQAILRRTYEYTMPVDKPVFEGISLDISKAKLLGEGFCIDLTKTELLILEYLFNMRGKIAKREDIMNHCWQGDDFIDDNTLAVNITRLRKKLRGVGYKEFIQTKKGMGYYLVRQI
ncbi:response regulator transcription factor [Lachnoanaerobaculum saburreum]|jgi:response regulator|uniref:Stage 0 sporulation protein A homolog n=1 Tax=Lachnoanaerobaculum saburreum DSM 3986 TaxID=887325 RepID=E6LL45_9FIRM|nr:response regulator transcription factor [Lachnoanaerobaculum saburreum]EFU77445.1 response regulator receiver domain protein [Lachnoanaerobaculum saburreum DSM 3986]